MRTARTDDKRVLLVVENASAPADSRVWLEALALRDADWDVTIISPRGDGYDEAGYEERDGVRIHRYVPHWAAGGVAGYVREYARAIREIAALAHRLASHRPFSVIHVANPPDVLLPALYALRHQRTRFIYDQHDLMPEMALSRFTRGARVVHGVTRAAEALAYRLADVVITTNESYRAMALTRGRRRPEDVFVVRNGPDRERFHPVAPRPELRRGKARLIVYAGVMGPLDGVDHALRALARVRDERNDWHALFLGDGEERSNMEVLAAELGLGDVVEFVGFRPRTELPSVLSTADVALAPEPRTPVNDRSTMMKIGEYMATATPMVAYDLAESRVTAGPAAVYARPNDPEDFARGITELLDDPARADALGREGRRRIEAGLAWEHSVPSLLAAYRRVLR